MPIICCTKREFNYCQNFVPLGSIKTSQCVQLFLWQSQHSIFEYIWSKFSHIWSSFALKIWSGFAYAFERLSHSNGPSELLLCSKIINQFFGTKFQLLILRSHLAHSCFWQVSWRHSSSWNELTFEAFTSYLHALTCSRLYESELLGFFLKSVLDAQYNTSVKKNTKSTHFHIKFRSILDFL